MQSFLSQVCAHLFDNHSEEFAQMVLVTPNRRAGLFLKKYFSQEIQKRGKAQWAPAVLSMEDFIESITRQSISDPLELSLEFYKAYKLIEGVQSEPLEEFLKWAPVLLSDFNDIDTHVPEPKELFDNVSDIKKLETWNPDGSEASEFQKKILTFFKKLEKYHQKLGEHLKESQLSYRGMAYRAAEQKLSKQKEACPWQRVFFIGFNALSQAEESIIKILQSQGIAKVLWDADKYYLSNPNHEAGLFLRHYKKTADTFEFEGDYFSREKKSINIYGLAKNISQAKFAGTVLQNIPHDDITSHHTAVVLADENLLLPMINSIPSNIEKINITMGYPLRKTQVYALFDAILHMHLTTQRMDTAREGLKSAFYYKDLLKILEHPALKTLWKQAYPGGKTENVIQSILAGNATFLALHNLAAKSEQAEIFQETFAFLFESFYENPERCIPALISLAHKLEDAWLADCSTQSIDIEHSSVFINYEALGPIHQILKKIQLHQENNQELMNIQSMVMLFQSLGRSQKVVLSGEPLEGLQIMGMLETRNLDFKNLIILSANEDILPASKGGNSLLPFDVKAQFGIPVYKEKDAIFAYHFYRLLQRAENIHILYNTQTQDVGSSEKSRFITQLQMELPKWNPFINIKEHIISLPSVSEKTDHTIRIEKSTDILHRLSEINQKGFSPTTLIHYIHCSLMFYFKHILSIKESESLEETLEAKTLGNVVHKVLEDLYNAEQLNGKTPSVQNIDKMLKRVESEVLLKFRELYPGGELETGKNHLLHKVALRYAINFLHWEKEQLIEYEKQNQKLIYLKSEDQLHAYMDIESISERIHFRGFADRVDELDGIRRIIDYKSGKVEDRDLIFKEWEDLIHKPEQSKSFQLFMYAFMYGQHHHCENQALIPGIISFRRISAGVMGVKHPGGSREIRPDDVTAFAKQLQTLMEEIYHPNIPFTRTEDESRCVNCDFRVVCHRI